MEGEFSTELIEWIKNRNGYIFYKLIIRGACQFELFQEEIKRSPRDEKSLYSIFALMEMFGAQLLPKKKYRQVHEVKRQDVFEFKKDRVRVYVVTQKPNIFIVLGGYKNDQDKDIKLLRNRLKGFEER